MTAPVKKIKVLHLITLSVVGGSQDNTFSTCERHDRDRYEVHLACNPFGHWIDRARESCDVFHPLPCLITPVHPWNDLKTFLDIVRLLRREKFDLVHTHTAKAGFLGRLAAAVCRVPNVVHTYHAFPFHDFMAAWKRWLYILLERCVRPATDFFITLSEADRREGLRLEILYGEKSRAVYTGIDFAKLDRAAEAQTTRTKLNIPDGWQVVITAGRLEPQKAPHLLVEAFSRVARVNPNTLLLIAGDGELRPVVEAKIEALGLQDRVRTLGYRDDVPDLLRMADVFAFSSLWEAMGRAMVEAMLLGKPVVVPAIYGIPEIVRHGETGLLYEVNNVTALAEQLCRALNDPNECARLGTNARQLTRQLFGVDQMVSQIELIYQQLARQAARTQRSPRAEALDTPLPIPQHGCLSDARPSLGLASHHVHSD